MREWTRAVDCHDFASAKSRNDKQKVDSSGVDSSKDKGGGNA
ncbi:hypothetical protein [Helicobacter canis]|uniref:Uncharacterized protein n=1 Tax=Helicobacter canis NCTC 12740 TaxID=1357399 RepID=V8CFF5_9HELI|nr:hypothetical protein [Helicobacter canis]ETD25842.1 hypothetical protein HMPREF2087_01675 [Helicobacter canis NCTC 12740]